MSKLLAKFKSIKSEFVKNVLVVITGTAVSQIIALAVTPILTRSYSPKDFGVLLIYMSILTIVGSISTGKYERVILLLKSEIEIKRIVLICFLTSIGISLILLLILMTCKWAIIKYLSFEDSLYNWLFSIPFLLVIYSLNIVFSTLLNYQKKYKTLSMAKVIKTLSSIIVSLSCIFFLKDARGLILGEISGYTFSLVFVFYSNSNFLTLKKNVLDGLKKIAIRYKEFPIYNIPSDFINITSAQMPAFFLTTYFGTGVTGFYSLMKRVLDAPVNLLSTSILEIFRQKAAQQYIENGNCKSLFIKTSRSLFLISIIPFILLFLFSPQIFSFLFGKEWAIAGQYSRIFSVYYCFKFISSPLSYMFYIAEKQKIDFLLHLYVFCSVIITLNLPKFINIDEITLLWIYSINFVLIYSTYFVLSYKFSCGKPIKKLF